MRRENTYKKGIFLRDKKNYRQFSKDKKKGDANVQYLC